MKIVAIGDTHGRNTWKKVLEQEADADHVVFIGDYFDSFAKALTADVQIANFKEIVALKRSNPEKYTVLIGNHDWHYAVPGQQCSGFQTLRATDISEVMVDAMIDMALTKPIDGFLFSHAGVTKTWCAAQGVDPADILGNKNYDLPTGSLSFCMADESGYGEHIAQSPIWVRPNSLMEDKIEGAHQVVGHTTQDHITYLDGVTLIDAIGSREYLIIEDGVLKTKTV